MLCVHVCLVMSNVMLKSLASWQAGEQKGDSAVVPTEMKNQHRRKNTHRQTHS